MNFPEPLVTEGGHEYIVEVFKEGLSDEWRPSANSIFRQQEIYDQIIRSTESEIPGLFSNMRYRIASELDLDRCLDCGAIEKSCICGDGFKSEEQG